MNTATDAHDARLKILNRIFNLRARAEDDASTEAEVDACLSRADAMMEAYKVSEAELALAEGRGEVKLEIVNKSTRAYRTTRIMPPVLLALYGIDRYCGTKSCYTSSTGQIHFTGHKPDVELAEYFVELIASTAPRAYAGWKREQGGAVGRGAKTSFERAFASRIARRLVDMALEREAEAEEKAEAVRTKQERAPQAQLTNSESTSLMIVDAAKVKRIETVKAFAKEHPRLGSGRAFSTSNGTAAGGGREAANRVGLGRPVGQSRAGLLS